MPSPRNQKKQECYFAANNITDIDYKDVDLLKQFISYYGKIMPRKYTGTSPKMQRKLATAIKRARVMALLPFVRQ
ncbi:MAG: 30S ribosomal protein S18 [Candidatus Jacksonbacteria bacterium RIFCSPLOWO2_02_FULL_43_9]|nr:MAG: 30S ribosomal protein S18 [Parcubacteria group bacterium GW2011_GWA2_43_13]OGY68611.1 MAG: 30S ribosomal protein S18 [Candidatus Jacksonbacteria bacterium RIFCSPHIGHO2_02_FULL_43_10]OGY71399.1 MAG: 30S ribosomal protein S18 [Candidatus Jacksonbacteria bacterium RIFCSPLOWO2_01_FULL_44_13]OGY73157.1 MAG: 30S ribosomal protein S18 [Candidatus Jacksonbacteria bacterium RIFCSPLOWO2_02_FULL_43_9]HAZ17052.1 30S ribosomal protein S18 [Candidatus Jacksonbacteria bacterium]HLD20321.1 30S ribosom